MRADLVHIHYLFANKHIVPVPTATDKEVVGADCRA